MNIFNNYFLEIHFTKATSLKGLFFKRSHGRFGKSFLLLLQEYLGLCCSCCFIWGSCSVKLRGLTNLTVQAQ